MFRGWQMNTKNPFPVEVSVAIQEFIKRYGYPPPVLEVSDQLENVELPEGLQVVVRSVRIPKNEILMGLKEEGE